MNINLPQHRELDSKDCENNSCDCCLKAVG